MAHLVGQTAADAGEAPLVAQEAVQAHGLGPEPFGQLLRLDAVGLGTELVEGRRAEDIVARYAPHAGAALGALLGKQPGRDLPGEDEASLPAARLGRPLHVDRKSAALHEVDHERNGLEASEEVLATATDFLEGAAVGLVGSREDRLQRGERERDELRQLPAGVVRSQPFSMRLDFGQLGHGASAVLGPRPDVGEHRVEGAEHGLRCEQPLLVTEQADVPVDERVLRVELPRGDGDGDVPGLLHANVLGLGWTWPEARRTGGNLEVVRDITLGTFPHDLGDADLVVGSQLAQLVVGLDDAPELVQPVETEVAHGAGGHDPSLPWQCARP